MTGGPERKNRVSHTVLALPRLGLVAYASLGLRQGFANPVPLSSSSLLSFGEKNPAPRAGPE